MPLLLPARLPTATATAVTLLPGIGRDAFNSPEHTYPSGVPVLSEPGPVQLLTATCCQAMGGFAASGGCAAAASKVALCCVHLSQLLRVNFDTNAQFFCLFACLPEYRLRASTFRANLPSWTLHLSLAASSASLMSSLLRLLQTLWCLLHGLLTLGVVAPVCCVQVAVGERESGIGRTDCTDTVSAV